MSIMNIPRRTTVIHANRCLFPERNHFKFLPGRATWLKIHHTHISYTVAEEFPWSSHDAAMVRFSPIMAAQQDMKHKLAERLDSTAGRPAERDLSQRKASGGREEDEIVRPHLMPSH